MAASLEEAFRYTDAITRGAYALRAENRELTDELARTCSLAEGLRYQLDASQLKVRTLEGRAESFRSPTHLPPPARPSYTPTGTSPYTTSPSLRAPFDLEAHNRWLAGVAARTGYQPPERDRQPPSHTPRLPAPTHLAGGVSLGRGPEPRERPTYPPHGVGVSSAVLGAPPVRDPRSADPTLREDVEEQGRTIRRLADEAEALRAAVLALPRQREPQPAERPERVTPPEDRTAARRSRRPARRAPPQEESPLTLRQLRTTRDSILGRIEELGRRGNPRGRRAREALEEELDSAYEALDAMEELIAERQPKPASRRTQRAAPPRERERLGGNDPSARGCYACTHDVAMQLMTDHRARSAAQKELGRSPH